MMQSPKARVLAMAYYHAKDIVISEGYADEVDWQYSVSFDLLTETGFIREVAWVILNSGMREAVVRNLFPQIDKAFLNFKSAKIICENITHCKTSALKVFSHAGKIDAIFSVCSYVATKGFELTKSMILNYGADFFIQFPYLGSATSLHLAKNIGLPVGKPDRHLVRVAAGLGYDDVQQLCSDISDLTDEPIPVVDLVIWRFSTMQFSKFENFSRVYRERYLTC